MWLLALSVIPRSFIKVAPAIAYEGIYGMEVVKPQDAVVDPDALTDDVKKALKDFKAIASSVKSLRSTFEADPQYAFDLKDLDIIKIRTVFNELVPVFDKDTQKGTDRLERGILQDIVEIETAVVVSPGKPRSSKKIKAVGDKLEKLDKTFDKLDAYFVSIN